MLARYNNNCYWLATTTLSLQRVTDLSFATCFPVAPQLASACSHLLTSATIGAWRQRLPISADNRHSVNAPLEFKRAKDKCRTEKCPRNKANYQKKIAETATKKITTSPHLSSKTITFLVHTISHNNSVESKTLNKPGLAN